MSADEYTKLFNYVAQRFDDLERKLDDKADRADTDRILNHLDDLRDELDSSDLETAARDAQLERHETWIRSASQATGVRYRPSA